MMFIVSIWDVIQVSLVAIGILTVIAIAVVRRRTARGPLPGVEPTWYPPPPPKGPQPPK